MFKMHTRKERVDKLVAISALHKCRVHQAYSDKVDLKTVNIHVNPTDLEIFSRLVEDSPQLKRSLPHYLSGGSIIFGYLRLVHSSMKFANDVQSDGFKDALNETLMSYDNDMKIHEDLLSSDKFKFLIEDCLTITEDFLKKTALQRGIQLKDPRSRCEETGVDHDMEDEAAEVAQTGYDGLFDRLRDLGDPFL